MGIQKIMHIPPNICPISTCISPVSGNSLPTEGVDSIFGSLSFPRILGYFPIFPHLLLIPFRKPKNKANPSSLCQPSHIHRECQCTRFSREQESEKVEGIVHTLCAVLKHVRNYLIFHKVKDLSSDSI